MRKYRECLSRRLPLDLAQFPMGSKARCNERNRLSKLRRMEKPENREREKARNAYYNANNRKYFREWARERTYTRYGMTAAMFEAMNQKQNGLCYLCCRPNEDSRKRRLAIDHDHACCSGTSACEKCLRHLLCDRCNRGLGFFRDDWQLLLKASEYVRTCGGKR